MSDQWIESKRLFQRAVDLPRDQQAAFVRRECSDSAICQMVLELLDNHNTEPGFLDSPLTPDPQVSLSQDPLVGREIGRYLIKGVIGKGGMGAVYRATQTNPAREVAIKVLRDDLPVSDRQLKRFQLESQVLGQLQHPGIGHVYESGTLKTSEGPRPWFAMELIDGLSLRAFCRQWKLSTPQLIGIFLKVADAVQHAHSKGVVHRDLKPGNILIQDIEQDSFGGGSPSVVIDVAKVQPKVVDFGIARVVETSAEQTPALTATFDVLGTLDYLSPEQAGLAGGEIDHRSDVYSLGIILFEMLSGRLPHDRSGKPFAIALARVMDGDTNRLRTQDSDFPVDLDVILEKSMRVEPEQRYASVGEMIADLERFLDGRPIAARPPTMVYRAHRWVRRNLVLTMGVAATMLALTIGLLLYASEARVAREAARAAQYEAEKAVAVSSFVTNDLLAQLLNQAGTNSTPSNLEVRVEQCLPAIETMFAERPKIKAAIHNEVGTVYYNMSAFEKACRQYRLALELWEAELGREHPDTLKAVNNLAQGQMSLGASEETEVLCQRAYQGRLRQLGLDALPTLRSLNNLAELYRRQGRLDQAEELFLKGLERQREILGPTDKATLITAANLGSVYVKQDRIEEAVKLHGDVYTAARKLLGGRHLTTQQTGFRYVQTLDRAKQYERALKVLQPLVVHALELSKQDSGAAILPLRLQARVERHRGQLKKARATLEQVLRIAERDPEKNKSGIEKIKRDLRRLRGFSGEHN